MKSIKDILNKKSSQEGFKGIIDEKTVLFVFEKVIKDEMGVIGKEKLRACKFSKGKIFIKTGSSAWASELWLNRDKIIGKVNNELGQDELQDIKIN